MHFQEKNTTKCVKFYFEKSAGPKRKEFGPFGSTFFTFRVDPFSEGIFSAEMKTGSDKRYLSCTNSLKSTETIMLPLILNSV